MNASNFDQRQSEKEYFDLVVEMGELTLLNDEEIYRTHETMLYTASQFELDGFQVFIIANGIPASAVVDQCIYSCQVRSVPLVPIEPCRIETLNELSRDVVQGLRTPAQLRGWLDHIKVMKASGTKLQIFASGCGSACFCYLFQGAWVDAMVAFEAGVTLYWFILWVLDRVGLPKIMRTILSSVGVVFFCFVSYYLDFGDSLGHIAIGAIFPLVPGVPLTNTVRNLLENDYLSELVRVVDALLTAGCIAIGVGIALSLGHLLLGGSM